MDGHGNHWYFSCMKQPQTIPSYALFGETDAFPDVVHCEHIKDRAPHHSWRIDPHRHAQLAQIFYIQTGSARAVVDGQRVDLKDNVLLFVPAQVVHSFHFAPQTQGMVQSFPVSILRSAGPTSAEMTSALAHPIVTEPSDALIALLTQLDAALRAPSPFRAQIAVGLAHAVLAATASLAHSSGQPGTRTRDDRLGRLDALIAQHQGKSWSASAYAAELGMSTGHLSRLCRTAKGLSASAYIEAALLQEACRLLAFTQLSVAEVGYRLGFSDPSYFSRRFRIAQGETPSVYRQRFSS